MEEKKALRTRLRAMRKALSPQAQRLASRAVCERVLAFEAYKRAKVVMAYIACRGELDVSPVMDDILSSGRTLLLPRCEEGGRLTARKIASLAALSPGAYGVPEPGEESPVALPETIDLILVPGVAFDRDFYRLGQGGGYYDRFLKETHAVRAGVCHSAALLDGVPREAHDMRMDAVITPKALILREG